MDLFRGPFNKNVFRKINTTQPQPAFRNWPKTLRSLSGFSGLIICLGICLIGGLWFFVRHQINADYDRTIAEASQETMNLAIAFEEHVRRVMADADKDMLNLKGAYELDGSSSPVLDAYANHATKDSSRNLIAVLNEQGILVAANIQEALTENRSDRDYFQVQRDTDSQKLFIGRPITSRSNGQHTIPLSRRINSPDGSFGGIVYTGIRADYFLSFYQKVYLGHNQLISIDGLDGFNRVRQVGDNATGGQDIRNSDFWKEVQGGRRFGSQINTSILDGITRVVSFRVMSDYPLTVLVGISAETALAGYEQRKQDYILWVSLISLIILVFCGLLISWYEKLQTQKDLLAEANATLEDKVNQRTQDLQDMNAMLEEEIAERAKADEQIRSQAQILDMAHDYIMVCDMDHKIIYWNRGAEAGYGWPASEAIGQLTPNLLKTQFPISREHIRERLLTEGHWEGELTHACKDGTQIVVHSYETLNRDSAGNPVAVLIINHDISDQKKYEVELSRLARLNTVGEIAASIGHEIRNPLTTVRGYLQLFQRREKLAEYGEQIHTMIEELDRANSIITEFLSLAKNKAVTQCSTDLNLVIQSLDPLLQSDALLRGREIKTELESIPDVMADASEIRQCILNLVSNALEATPKGGAVTISTTERRGRVVLTVRDQGPGIPPEIRAKMGTPFFTTKDNGTGLGLAVCYRIAQRHETSIEVETGPEGSAFHFIFNLPPNS